MAKIKEIDPAPLNGGPYGKSDSSLPSANDRLGGTPLTPTPRCLVSMQPDGKLAVSFLIESTEANRIIRRAGNMDISRYMWENILHRAISDHVY